MASVSGGPSFTYDANGNVITRSLSGGQVARLTYDAEGRVVKVESYSTKVSGNYTTLADFVYNGDG